MIMGGVQSKVLVAILKKTSVSTSSEVTLEFLPSVGRGEYGYFLELHNSEKM